MRRVAFGIVALFFIGLVFALWSIPSAKANPPAKEEVVKGGMTAVLFDCGDIFDLTSNGWKPAHHLPAGLAPKDVAVVLSSDRVVAKDGTGYTYSGGEWKRWPSPVH